MSIENLKELRKKIQGMAMGSHNVDKLMTDKVNDYVLIEEQPLGIDIGKHTIYIGNFTLENNFKFWDSYGRLLACLGMKFINFDLIGDPKELYKTLYGNRMLYKGLVRIIGKTILKQQTYYLDQFKERKKITWKNCSYRYFKKNMSMEKLLQICKIVYLYNFDAEKKNLQILMGSITKEEEIKQATETYMYSWLQNLPGLTGKFQLSLLTNTDYWHDDSMKETVSTKDGKKGVKSGTK